MHQKNKKSLPAIGPMQVKFEHTFCDGKEFGHFADFLAGIKRYKQDGIGLIDDFKKLIEAQSRLISMRYKGEIGPVPFHAEAKKLEKIKRKLFNPQKNISV